MQWGTAVGSDGHGSPTEEGDQHLRPSGSLIRVICMPIVGGQPKLSCVLSAIMDTGSVMDGQI